MLGHHSIFWWWAAFLAVSFVFSIVTSMFRGRKRLQDMAASAQKFGFSFTPWEGPSSTPKYPTELFQKYPRGSLKNVLSGQYASMPVQVFDYSYSSGSAQNSTTTSQTVAVYTQPADLPYFALGPGGLAGKIIDALEHQNVPLNSSSSFSRHYAVRGPDPERIRSLFNSRLLSFVEALDHSKQWHIEGAGKTLVVYRWNRRVKPSDLENFLQETSSIAQQFFTLSAAAGQSSA
jgi:hypothetical protein